MFKKRKKIELYYHLFKAMKNKKILTFLMFILTILISLLLIWNIKAIEYITALLISKSIIDSILSINTTNIYNISKQLNLNFSQDQINHFLNNFNYYSNFYEQIIKKFFYDFINYDGKKIYIIIFEKKYDLYLFSFTIIGDIIFIIIIFYINFIISGYISQSYEMKLKKKLINKIIDQDFHYFNYNKTNKLISTIVKDNLIVISYIKEAPIIYILTIVTIIFSLILMFNINWKLTLCVFGLLFIFILVILISILISNNIFKKIDKISQNLDNEISEKIYNIKLIKSSGSFEEEKKYFNEKIKNVLKNKNKKLFSLEITSSLIIGGIGSFTMASIIFGVFLYYNKTQSLISIITSFTTGVIVMTVPIMQLRQIIYETPQAKISAINVSEIIKSKIFIKKDKKEKINEKINSIAFKNISFSYPESNKFVIKNFNINLIKGKKYAFVGLNGSGKSTIIKLLLRFYDPKEGKIIINNKIELKKINLKSWLDKIGYIDQEPQILNKNIYDNISYGLKNKNKKEIINACKKAKIHNLIISFPKKYNTVLFEYGSQLSSGQKQRFIIARLILKNPEILILDEATNALDNIVESEIQKELIKLIKGKTIICITHKLNMIKNFDEIFVLEQKKGIVKSGNFKNLILSGGLFKKLYELSK